MLNIETKPNFTVNLHAVYKVTPGAYAAMTEDKMEVYCSFKKIAGGICGYDSRDRKRQAEIVPLSSCKKDIAKHLTLFSFLGPPNEMDLILCRAAIFQEKESLNTMIICANHSGKLGL